MSTIPALPTYKEVTSALKNTPAKYHAAQVHGLMCGLICATSGKNDDHWQKQFLTEENKKSVEILQQLYETSYHQLSDFSFEFVLLLPEDTTDINQRAESLGLWCQGFLTGLEQGNVPITNRPMSEVTEAINDLVEISQVNYGDIAENDEDETAYFELVEYVRLAVLMIFQELRPVTPPAQNKSLH